VGERRPPVEVFVDPELGLASLTVRRPDGTIAPLVADPDELRAVANRLVEVARERIVRGETEASINFAEVIGEVLGPERLEP
jgi:hypothetical protein